MIQVKSRQEQQLKVGEDVRDCGENLNFIFFSGEKLFTATVGGAGNISIGAGRCLHWNIRS